MSDNRQYFVSDFTDDPNRLPSTGSSRSFSIKTESSASPNLPPASLHHFQFQFRSQLPSQGNNNLEGSTTSPASPVYRFGSDAAVFDTMSHPQWPSSSNSSQHLSSSAGHMTSVEMSQNHNLHIASMPHTMSFNDEYEDTDELSELPGGMSGGLGQSGGSQLGEKAIRRRSSKACDQCRKSKCKCERTADGEACRSCITLGTQCTFLGPSRKRGPPKGYIDAIEARLHQTEALLGIMIASGDDRARGLLDDLKNDSLAKEIINRVDNSPYGSKGRKRGAEVPGGGGKARPGTSGSTSPVQHGPPKTKPDLEPQQAEFTTTHPSNEWQDRVSTLLRATGNPRVAHPPDASDSLLALRYANSGQPQTEQLSQSTSGERPALRVVPPGTNTGVSEISPMKRQRRRLETDFSMGPVSGPASALPGPSLTREPYFPLHLTRSMGSLTSQMSAALGEGMKIRRSTSPADSLSSDSEEGLTDAVGQLSLNEDEQVRYHGKVSGLHLLGHKERLDGRNEGGIWRLPKARVWPPLPSDAREKARLSGMAVSEDEYTSQLPDSATQEHLLELYFTYVHPALPVVHKKAFFEVFRATDPGPESPGSSTSDGPSVSSSPFNRRRRRVPTLLLLAMFAISARYSNTSAQPPPTDGSMMWAAGDSYLDSAKVILDGSYGSSRASTCQALLLMGYREVGIGAMAQAWIYIGMAVRMAQDLGLHRSADGWARVGLGGRLFSELELQERKRIWYTCVIMDKYVSTYIGRPLAIFEGDFDTPLPNEDDDEELEMWQPHLSDPQSTVPWEPAPTAQLAPFTPVPGRVISCFNASARLSGLLSTIIQTIYATRPCASRHAGREYLEGLLDKWYLELPEHLRHDPGSSKPPILPTVLTLHMQYWCTVLLLHRPFIGYMGGSARSKESANAVSPQDNKDRALPKKSYELCAAAANHITTVVSTYLEHHCIRRSAVFLCYYIFTASIMHITTLTTYPSDPQARLGLRTCMDALGRMEIVWPSAARALDLLRGSKVNLEENELALLSSHPDRHKRSAENPMDAEDAIERGHLPQSASTDYLPMRSHNFSPSGYQSDPTGYSDSIPLQSGPSGMSVPYYSAYERWAAENSDGLQYPGTLSTSVLPQLYSTGLVDDRAPIGIHNRSQGNADVHANGHNRYPQYWNDYSTFPQLGTAYGIPDPVQVPHHSPTVPQNQPPNMYMPDHYNLYHNHPSNS